MPSSPAEAECLNADCATESMHQGSTRVGSPCGRICCMITEWVVQGVVSEHRVLCVCMAAQHMLHDSTCAQPAING